MIKHICFTALLIAGLSLTSFDIHAQQKNKNNKAKPAKKGANKKAPAKKEEPAKEAPKELTPQEKLRNNIAAYNKAVARCRECLPNWHIRFVGIFRHGPMCQWSMSPNERLNGFGSVQDTESFSVDDDFFIVEWGVF